MALKNLEIPFPLVIAHRGLSSKAPENTLAAISLAADNGMKWVEVDIKLTADDKFVLCHDESVDRTTNGNGKVSEMTSNTLYSLDAGSWFNDNFKDEKIPSLEKVLQLCKKFNLGINLELKPEINNTEGFSEKLLPLITPYLAQGAQLLVSSFNKKVIIDLHKINPEIPIGFLIEDKDNQQSILEFCKKTQCFSIHIPDKYCTKEILEKMRPLNRKLFVYTVNSKERAHELFSMGVDAIFSGYNLSLDYLKLTK